MKYAVTAFVAVMMMVFACGYEPEASDSTGFSAASGGTRSGGSGSQGDNPPQTPVDSGMPFSNTSACGDAGFCAAGECCGGTCCAISQMCCSGRCLTPTLNMPTCDFSLPPVP